MNPPQMPTINEKREVHFESAEHFCAVYDNYLAKGGLCVEGPVMPDPLEEVEFRLVLPTPPGQSFLVPGRVVSLVDGRAIIQFVAFGDDQRTRLSKAWEEAKASTLGDKGGETPARRHCPKCGTVYGTDVGFCSQDGAQLVDGQTNAKQVAGKGGELEIGTVLGPYKLTEHIGVGGMGDVYKAEHLRLGRKVAVKLLRQDYAANPNAVKRFFGEALAVNQINHEHIVEISDYNDSGDGPIYYIMELLEGQTLQEACEAAGTLALGRALHIAVQICDTLAAVHEAGIVHRDLKPENIFLIRKGEVDDFAKVLDFGVAKLMADSNSEAMVKTSAGALLGTPDYMAPEQVMGKEVDHRADLYAFGVILYQMVSAKKPVVAGNIGELVYRHMAEKPKPLSELEGLTYAVPPALEALVMACLAKDPQGRPDSAAAVAAELRAIAGTL